ncbi:PQQ-binding-like beta-propeller repeat protein [Nocardiopsis sp. ATB16-24]|uniref:outer membrane protein assembly factor BamB family protein n=1 Tax=Nocardiopsis sp. ATB16-24 TaxID=3019555 RepID=UPI002552A58C|nr:PQQ-binding-like beta-propeller repeat protein [Nocardiopsis sp. ATB16-24]
MTDRGRPSAVASASPVRGRRRRFIGCLAVPAALLVVVLIATVAVHGLRSGRYVLFPEVSTTPAWSARGLPGTTVGAWWTPEVVVHASQAGLRALSPVDGTELWRWEAEGTVCGMSEEVDDRFGVLLLEGPTEDPDPVADAPARTCDVVVGVDLVDGRRAWRTDPLFGSGTGAEPFPDGSQTVVGEQVLVRVGARLWGFDRRTGQELWHRDEFDVEGTRCPAVDLLPRSPDAVVVATDCGLGGPVTVHVTDTTTGEDASAFVFPRGDAQPNITSVGRTHVVAADPIHVRVDLGHAYGPGRGYGSGDQAPGSARAHTLVFGDDGTLRRTLDIEHAFDTRSDTDPFVLVVDGVVYSSTRNTSCSNSVHAHDLATGEHLWETRMSGSGHEATAVLDDRLLVLRGGTAPYGECSLLAPERTWQLYALDTVTGRERPLSPQMGDLHHPSASGAWWHDGRVFLLQHRAGEDSGGIVALH